LKAQHLGVSELQRSAEIMKCLLLTFFLASALRADVEYLFAAPMIPSGSAPTTPFIVRESDKQKIPEMYWHVKDSNGFVDLYRWMRREGKIEPIQIKMMAAELYRESDFAMMREIALKLKKEEKTEPNQAVEPTTMRVTDPANAGSAPRMVAAHL
jgi:hypothetical protein